MGCTEGAADIFSELCCSHPEYAAPTSSTRRFLGVGMGEDLYVYSQIGVQTNYSERGPPRISKLLGWIGEYMEISLEIACDAQNSSVLVEGSQELAAVCFRIT